METKEISREEIKGLEVLSAGYKAIAGTAALRTHEAALVHGGIVGAAHQII